MQYMSSSTFVFEREIDKEKRESLIIVCQLEMVNFTPRTHKFIFIHGMLWILDPKDDVDNEFNRIGELE